MNPPELSEEVKRGRFINNVSTWHSENEFIIDLGFVTPESIASNSPTPLVQSRCIMSPPMFKVLVKNLSDALVKFEKQFGEIKLPEVKEPKSKKPGETSHYM